MVPDPLFKESRSVFLLVEVVGLSQPGKEPSPAHPKRTTGESLLDRRTEAPRGVPRNAAEHRLPVLAKVRTQKRQQLEHRPVGDLIGNLWTFATLASHALG